MPTSQRSPRPRNAAVRAGDDVLRLDLDVANAVEDAQQGLPTRTRTVGSDQLRAPCSGSEPGRPDPARSWTSTRSQSALRQGGVEQHREVQQAEVSGARQQRFRSGRDSDALRLPVRASGRRTGGATPSGRAVAADCHPEPPRRPGGRREEAAATIPGPEAAVRWVSWAVGGSTACQARSSASTGSSVSQRRWAPRVTWTQARPARFPRVVSLISSSSSPIAPAWLGRFRHAQAGRRDRCATLS